VRRLKRQLLKLANYPRYGPVGLHDPQQEVEVWLEGPDGLSRDVTYNNVVAALRPFTIGVMFDRDSAHSGGWRLCMRERQEPRRLLGVIHLRLARTIRLAEHRFHLFETSSCENYSVSALCLQLYYLQQRWRAELKKRRNVYNFQMTPADLRCSYVFYICPRPVVLVTVQHEDAGNLFPMDLIGPTDSPWFSMALRSTSPAVRLMQQSRRMALASVPFQYKNVAYELGKHHKKTNIDWAGLPLKMMRSPLFGLRVPEAALRLREVHVEEFHEVGSHMLFITSIERETAGRDGLQLFHRYGSY
jgi:flavin reductase (DIM6/NTAB) family NADH-FMN oxidoreductase RutF